MKQTTIEKIIREAGNYSDNDFGFKGTVIGRYTYRFNVNTGDITRCKTVDIGRMWFDCEGNRCDGWEVVAHAN